MGVLLLNDYVHTVRTVMVVAVFVFIRQPFANVSV